MWLAGCMAMMRNMMRMGAAQPGMAPMQGAGPAATPGMGMGAMADGNIGAMMSVGLVGGILFFILGFLIGLIVTLAGKNANLDPRVLLFLQVGVCGGFTTFSSFALETHTLLQGGKLLTALSYICLSVVLCVCATALSSALAK